MHPVTLYTVGHGRRSLAELLDLLAAAAIACLVDVRAQPGSARHPQFNMEPLRAALAARAVAYHWAGRQLGGLREPRPDSPHTALPAGLRGFADHMDGEAFQKGVAQLLSLAMKAPTAILCAERPPEQCHRGLIADFLVLGGARVLHLIEPGDTREHQLSALARPESGRLVYDRGGQRPPRLN
jgi:uncharacterized protein (DUF488 family)